MATAYKSKFTGEQIDNSVETIVSNTATDGQVLTANGTGGATWQDAKGTEVVANPSLAGTESDLTGLEVAGTKYKVPTGGSGGGTHLYVHTISIIESNHTCEFSIYLLTSTPINTLSDLTSALRVNSGFYVSGKTSIGDIDYTLRTIYVTSASELSVTYYGENTPFATYTFSASEIILFEDNVTQL